jgi:membrane fusion protein (multidrug efflux system)
MSDAGERQDAEHVSRHETARGRALSALLRPNRTNLIAALLAVATIVGLGWWVQDRLAHVHVSDARIAATMVSVSARASGWIRAFPVDEGQRVERGDLLLVLEDDEAQTLANELEARVAGLEADRRQLQARREMVDAQTSSRIRGRQSRLEAARSAVSAAESEFARAEANWERAAPLLEREVISRQQWEQERDLYLQARSRLESARAEVQAVRSALAELEADRTELALIDDQVAALEHRIEEARARLDRQRLELDDHRVLSPTTGVIDETFVDSGEHVSRGQRVLMMHDPDVVWVSANVKETAIRHLQVGNAARLHVDGLPGRPLHGRLSRIGHAATNQFALLPNPNPSGNFTKITQRIEVRIEIEDPVPDLRPGMMVEVEFDI